MGITTYDIALLGYVGRYLVLIPGHTKTEKLREANNPVSSQFRTSFKISQISNVTRDQLSYGKHLALQLK